MFPQRSGNRRFVGYLNLRRTVDEELLAEPRLDDPQMSFQLGQLLNDLDKRQVLLSMRSEIRPPASIWWQFCPSIWRRLNSRGLPGALAR